MNPFRWPFRANYALGAAIIAALYAYAVHVQFDLGIEPCPLCIFQRVAFIGMALFFVLGMLHGPKAGGRKVYGVLVALCGVAGMIVAGRHIWLQHLPKDQVPACGPGLSWMLDTFPLSKTFKMVFTGSGECAEVNWTFLGFSMPEWTFVCFLGLTLAALWAAWTRIRA